jgi:hypothetical protein
VGCAGSLLVELLMVMDTSEKSGKRESLPEMARQRHS